MTEFNLKPDKLGMYIHQNRAEFMECVEGCLLDSFVLACKRGYAFCYEQPVNPNMSTYFVRFVPYEGETEEFWVQWHEFERSAA